MFKSKTRQITIPQSEHARLSGYLAYFWGNAEVAPPPVDQTSFAMGVTYHDRGYGQLDTMAIGEVDHAIWLATQRRGIRMSVADSVADTVALMHIRRLVSHVDQDDARKLVRLAEEYVERNISQTPNARQDFERADTITELCDNIAFQFCFEELATLEQSVYSRDALVSVQVSIKASGRVQLHPWPLSVPELRGFIIGYELSGYPDHLQPVLVEFAITP